MVDPTAHEAPGHRRRQRQNAALAQRRHGSFRRFSQPPRIAQDRLIITRQLRNRPQVVTHLRQSANEKLHRTRIGQAVDGDVFHLHAAAPVGGVQRMVDVGDANILQHQTFNRRLRQTFNKQTVFTAARFQVFNHDIAKTR